MRQPRIVQDVQGILWLWSQSIRHDVYVKRARYRDEGSVAWAVDDLRLAWADTLVVLSGEPS